MSFPPTDAGSSLRPIAILAARTVPHLSRQRHRWIVPLLLALSLSLPMTAQADQDDHLIAELQALRGSGDTSAAAVQRLRAIEAQTAGDASYPLRREILRADLVVLDSLEDCNAQTKHFLSNKGKRSVDSFHRELGHIIWDYCGMSRTAEGLQTALQKIPALREEFWQNLKVTGTGEELNQTLEKAGRVADFLEMGELMCLDALTRDESCGGHFREEHQTAEGEAKRDDENFQHAAAWEWTGEPGKPKLNKEALDFEYVKPSQRSYK